MYLITDRLILRPFRENDFAALRALVADPRIFHYRSRSSISEDQTRAFLTQAYQALTELSWPLYAFALLPRTTFQLIGECGLTRLADQPDAAFLWYTLSPAFWKQGYMTEVARAVVQFGFTSAHFRRIVARCDPDNHASRRILERLGMVQRDEQPLAPNVPCNHHASLNYEIEQTMWFEQSEARSLIARRTRACSPTAFNACRGQATRYGPAFDQRRERGPYSCSHGQAVRRCRCSPRSRTACSILYEALLRNPS